VVNNAVDKAMDSPRKEALKKVERKKEQKSPISVIQYFQEIRREYWRGMVSRDPLVAYKVALILNQRSLESRFQHLHETQEKSARHEAVWQTKLNNLTLHPVWKNIQGLSYQL
jgi:hypothetical protein